MKSPTMRVVVLACMKGGSGKTTTTGHLGVTLEQIGQGPVALIDLDPQESLSKWWNRRVAETPAFAKPDSVRAGSLREKLAQLEEGGFSWCVIDTPPANGDVNGSAISVADLVVIPIKPGPHDLDAAQNTVNLCIKAGKPFRFLLNEIKSGTNTSDATSALSALGCVAPMVIGDRNAYLTSMIDGRTIGELVPGGKGEQEQIRLAQYVVDQFPEKRKPKKEKAHV